MTTPSRRVTALVTSGVYCSYFSVRRLLSSLFLNPSSCATKTGSISVHPPSVPAVPLTMSDASPAPVPDNAAAAPQAVEETPGHKVSDPSHPTNSTDRLYNRFFAAISHIPPPTKDSGPSSRASLLTCMIFFPSPYTYFPDLYISLTAFRLRSSSVALALPDMALCPLQPWRLPPRLSLL